MTIFIPATVPPVAVAARTPPRFHSTEPTRRIFDRRVALGLRATAGLLTAVRPCSSLNRYVLGHAERSDQHTRRHRPRHRWRRLHRFPHGALPARGRPGRRRARFARTRPSRGGHRRTARRRRHPRPRSRDRHVQRATASPSSCTSPRTSRSASRWSTGEVLAKQRRRQRRAGGGMPGIGCPRRRVLVVVLGLRHPGGRPGHGDGADPARVGLRRVEGDGRADPPLVRPDERSPLRQPALLQCGRGELRRADRRGLDPLASTSSRSR